MKENLKPFDLEAALAGKPVVTRCGRPVKIAGYNKDAKPVSNVAGWFDGVVESWSEDGSYYEDRESEYDLFMSVKKREAWVCYANKDGSKWLCEGESEQDAKAKAQASKAEIISTVKIWEEEI